VGARCVLSLKTSYSAARNELAHVEARKSAGKTIPNADPANLKWDELRAALSSVGYEMLSGKGSRRKFVHKDTKAIISCHEPHPSPDVDKGCIVDIVAHLKAHGFIKDQQ
jgi:predicted RNA binding protein YcfA (HicA-like mRNA interferase family)